MQLILKSGKAVNYPRTAQDITLRQYITWHNDVRPTTPQEILQYDTLVNELKEIEKELERYYRQSGAKTPDELQQYLESGRAKNSAKRFLPSLLTRWYETVEGLERMYFISDALWIAKNWHPYQLRVVQTLTGIQEELTVQELRFLFDRCTQALAVPEKLEYKQIYKHEGIVYTLPDKLMSKSTLIEFAEAAQYDAALKQAQNGDAEGLLKMCAVLMRPSGVEEHNEAVFDRNVEALQTLPLQTAYEISFFLTWLSAKYTLNSNRSTLAGLLRQTQN